jgi:phosphatidylglycerophosphate synthase
VTLEQASLPAARRQLKTRNRAWAQGLARILARLGVSPNAISLASLIFAVFGAVSFYRLGDAQGGARWGFALGAAAAIQLRLLANLIDGLVAVENQRKTATGDLWNEVPDRVADVLFLAGAGYGLRGLSAIGPAELTGQLLGWLAAALSLATAYLRQLGGALGLPQDFGGPMAKQHRMFVLTLGALATPFDASWNPDVRSGGLALALAIIVAGSAHTSLLRLRRLATALDARGPRA